MFHSLSSLPVALGEGKFSYKMEPHVVLFKNIQQIVIKVFPYWASYHKIKGGKSVYLCVCWRGWCRVSRKLLNSLGSPIDYLEVLFKRILCAHLFPFFPASWLLKYKILVSGDVSGYLLQWYSTGGHFVTQGI